MKAQIKALKKMPKKELKARSNSLFGKLGYIVFGVPVGWMICHYFVDLYGGVFPNESLIQFSADCTRNIWGFLKVLGISSIPALIAVYNAFLRKRRTDDK